MTSADSVLLIRRAKNGDAEARKAIIERYYPLWIARTRGRAGPRRLYDTVDIVQSAIAEALERMSDLRNEGAFFAWVSTIIEHKRAGKWRRERHRATVTLDEFLESASDDPRLADDGPDNDEAADVRSEYERVLDGIGKLFGKYPEAMAAVSLRYVRGLEIADVVATLDRSERSVFRLLDAGKELLRTQLAST